MLLNTSNLLIPEVYDAIFRMGHFDELLIADANYGASGMSPRVVHSGALLNHELLDMILRYFPLDEDEEFGVNVMIPDYGYDHAPGIWQDYEGVLKKHGYQGTNIFGKIPRHEFYSRSKSAYATIQTGDPRLYADILIRKGVVIK